MTKNWKIILTSCLFLTGSLFFTGCGSGNEQEKNSEEQTEKSEKKESEELSGYICPMQCEGKKTYEEKGKCPECGMKLKPVDEVLEK